jgi:hypothetical protein
VAKEHAGLPGEGEHHVARRELALSAVEEDYEFEPVPLATPGKVFTSEVARCVVQAIGSQDIAPSSSRASDSEPMNPPIAQERVASACLTRKGHCPR